MDKEGSGDWEGLRSSIWLFTALFLYTRHSVASTEVQPQAFYKINVSVFQQENSGTNHQFGK